MNMTFDVGSGVQRHYRRAAAVAVAALVCSLLLFAILFIGLMLAAIAAGPLPYGTLGSPT
jgi:hypothetical protein